jgi:nucleotide-binding universal stress UspA family protein
VASILFLFTDGDRPPALPIMKSKPPTTILAAIDFSRASQPVLATAFALAGSAKARLLIVHVVHPPPVTDPDAGVQMTSEYTAMASETAARQLEDLAGEIGRGLVVETTHRVGLPARCILDAAEEFGARYIVMGSHGQTALRDLVVGSTTSRVLKHATCPVVVVPPDTQSAATTEQRQDLSAPRGRSHSRPR